MPGKADRATRVIALMNQKGGVGKTTTCVNLAAAIAATGRRTLLVDLDPQAHATLHLGVEPGELSERNRGSAYDLLLDPAHDPANTLIEVRNNLSLIPSETDMAAAESELGALPERHERLRSALQRLESAPAGGHEFVLLDCPPSLGLLTLNALAAAREVIIPMQAHFLALQGVGKLLETIQLVRRQLNPSLSVAGVVLCMHDAQTTHTREVVDDLRGFFNAAREQDVPWRFAQVYNPPIRRNIKLAECPSFGQTIFDYAPWAPGALDYRKLGEEIVREWDTMIDMIDARDDASPLSEAEITVLRGSLGATERSA